MARPSREDALRFYKHYYAPNNAILVVAGDVTPEEVKRLAEETYGKVPANPEVGVRKRPEEPPHIALLALSQGSARRKRLVPPLLRRPQLFDGQAGRGRSARPVDEDFLADGSTSRLYRKLVVEDEIASTTGGDYSGWGLDGGAVSLNAVAAGNIGLDKVEASVDGVLDVIRANGVTEAELARAKKSLLADYIYESDDQESLANRYGWGATGGRSVKDIENWPQAISKVTPDDVKRAADTYLDLRGSITGWLEPEEPEGAGKPIEQPVAHSVVNPPLRKVSSFSVWFASSGAFRFGSDSEDPSMSAARPLHPTQQTSAEASLNACEGPQADMQALCGPIARSPLDSNQRTSVPMEAYARRNLLEVACWIQSGCLNKAAERQRPTQTRI